MHASSQLPCAQPSHGGAHATLARATNRTPLQVLRAQATILHLSLHVSAFVHTNAHTILTPAGCVCCPPRATCANASSCSHTHKRHTPHLDTCRLHVLPTASHRHARKLMLTTATHIHHFDAYWPGVPPAASHAHVPACVHTVACTHRGMYQHVYTPWHMLQLRIGHKNGARTCTTLMAAGYVCCPLQVTSRQVPGVTSTMPS